MRDYKDIWNEAFNEALELGFSRDEAIKRAEDALDDYFSEYEDQYDAWREKEFGDD